MKKLFCVFLLSILSSSFSFCQTDVSVWFKVRDGKVTTIPWFTFTNKSVFVDARYNFDQGRSAGVFVGKSFNFEDFSITPAIGGIFGDYNGLSPEVYTSWKVKKLSFFCLNQYSVGTWDSKGTNFFYHWLDIMYPVKKDFFFVGFDEQVYKESKLDPEMDLGPVVKMQRKGFYVKVWYAFAEGPDKIFIGIGYCR